MAWADMYSLCRLQKTLWRLQEHSTGCLWRVKTVDLLIHGCCFLIHGGIQQQIPQTYWGPTCTLRFSKLCHYKLMAQFTFALCRSESMFNGIPFTLWLLKTTRIHLLTSSSNQNYISNYKRLWDYFIQARVTAEQFNSFKWNWNLWLWNCFKTELDILIWENVLILAFWP